MIVSLSGSGPLYQQVYRALRDAILAGVLRAGGRLPVSRALALELGVSRNVVLIAYEQLIAEGYAAGRVGSGTYVAAAIPDSMIRAQGVPRNESSIGERSPAHLSRYARRLLNSASDSPPLEMAKDRARYDFAYYLTSADDFPMRLWQRLLARRPNPDYSAVEGDAGLRVEIAGYLRRTRAVECEPDQVLLVNGSQQALDLTARVLLDPGDTVVVEEPHYTGAREVFQAVGARILPVPVDRSGMDVARLPKIRRARLAYVTPSHQFPTGAILPLDRRLALLAWAANTGAYILEDDYDGEYRYEGRPVEAVQSLDRDGRVVYVGTFSRILFPSLRMGYVVVPRALRSALSSAKWTADRHTSLSQQAALADFMREGYFERYVRRARARNAARRQTALKALERNFGDTIQILGAAAGSHLLVRFRAVRENRSGDLIARALSAGVRVYSATPYYLQPPSRCEIVLGYGSLPERDIIAGIRLWRTAIGPLLQ